MVIFLFTPFFFQFIILVKNQGVVNSISNLPDEEIPTLSSSDINLGNLSDLGVKCMQTILSNLFHISEVPSIDIISLPFQMGTM